MMRTTSVDMGTGVIWDPTVTSGFPTQNMDGVLTMMAAGPITTIAGSGFRMNRGYGPPIITVDGDGLSILDGTGFREMFSGLPGYPGTRMVITSAGARSIITIIRSSITIISIAIRPFKNRRL